MLENLKKPFINIFILVHVFMITVWSFPTEMKHKIPIDRFFAPYFYFTGIWQGWDMFAPNPRSTKIRMDAYVYFKDGSRKVWEFPQMDKLSYYKRFQKERFRKWAHDNVRNDSSSHLWLPAVQYIARELEDLSNPITKIELNRHWYELKITDATREVASSEWNHYTFFKKEF